VPTDPAPFLSTIALASAGLVAIVGGLLIARFVSLDSDQRGSRKTMDEARARLDSARQRARDARDNHLDWHAGLFFRGPVLKALSKGISDPAVLMRLDVGWPFTEQELQPYAADVAGEFVRARATLAEHESAIDQFGGLDAWDDFRRVTSDLPEIRWGRVWEEAFDEIKLEHLEEQASTDRRARARRRREREQRARSSPLGFNLPDLEGLAEQLATPSYALTGLVTPPTTDHGVTRARREDELRTADDRARQQVEDYEAELARLRQAHAEIVRPDARLWWGVGILTGYAIAGVGLPMWVMSRGPSDLSQVRWVFYPFAIGLAALIIYIIVYLAKLTRTPQDTRAAGNRLGWPDRLVRALYSYEWHPRHRTDRPKTWP
jgi:hypothetical protein